MKLYYKTQQILLQNAAKVYYKSVSFFAAKWKSFITTCDNYYKMRHAPVQCYFKSIVYESKSFFVQQNL